MKNSSSIQEDKEAKKSPEDFNKREKKAEQKSLSQFFKASNPVLTSNSNDQSGIGGVKHKIQINDADGGLGNDLRIWHWNVNGIRATINSKKFEDFVVKGKFDFLNLISILLLN